MQARGHNTQNEQEGFLLISSLVILSVMIIIVSFYLNAIIQQLRVFDIVDTSPQTYYLAEAGIQEAIWKLQNDASWKNSFETQVNWSDSFTRVDALTAGSSYEVSVENVTYANALITATSTIGVRGTNAQRVVKVNVFKALNTEPIDASSMFANDTIKGVGSDVVVNNGGIFANSDIDLSLFSTWSTPGQARAVDDIDVSITSSLSAGEGIFDQSNPPIPEAILMPQIDFDSDDSTSYKSRADQVYTSNQFKTLLDDYPTTSLTGITYVTGNVFIKKGDDLTINGVLVADGSISIGNGFSFDWNPAVLTVNNVATTTPSGLLSKKNITIGGFNSQVIVDGLIYAGGTFTIKDGITQNVTTDITGAIIAQDIEIVISWEPTTVELEQAFVNATIGEPLFSQILFINHWEEEY